MKKEIKIYLIMVAVVILIMIAILVVKNYNQQKIDEETTKCIAENSLVYTSKTCSYCKKQKEIFGNYFELLNKVDCFYETEKCVEANIPGYPVWIINNKQYLGVKTIEELKELTGC